MPSNNLYLGVSEPEKVGDYLLALDHPLLEIVRSLRSIILEIDPELGEGIFWNAPTFYYTGFLPPFDAKTYKRYIVGFVFNKKDSIRLVFLNGASVHNHGEILEGNYTDGRRLAVFKTKEEVSKKRESLQLIIKELIEKLRSEV